MFCGGRGWREEGSGDRKLFIVRVSFYLWETSARTITESVVSRCVNVWTFFSTLKQYDGELCRAPWFNLNKDQKCTKWNRLRAGAVWPLEDPELWSPQAKIRLFFFLLSCLCFTDRFVSFSYLTFQVFLWLSVSMRPHYLSWSAAAKSHLINEQILVFPQAWSDIKTTRHEMFLCFLGLYSLKVWFIRNPKSDTKCWFFDIKLSK